MAGAWFVEVLGDGLTFRLVPGTPLLLGRSPDCGIILQSDHAGARHASFLLQDDRVLLRQESGWRPTTLNQVAVSQPQLPLFLDDVLRVGEYHLRLVRGCDVSAICLAYEGAMIVQFAGLLAREKRYDELPFLADALEDAGCADAELLSHLRSPGPHVRGCWALDLVLGKS